jgi:putative ABC transport system permease protein
MRTLIQDLRYGLRTLRKNPGFTAIAVLTLALGIGANTAIFSVVNGVLLRPLPFRHPSRLVLIAEKSSFPVISTSRENYLDWRDQSHSFEAMEATRSGSITLTGAGEPERLNVRMATAGLFPMLGINAQVGRTFLAEEDRAGGTPVALLSYGLWQRRFGGSPDIIGKTINLDLQPYTVVGILPNGFQILQPADVYLPFMPWARSRGSGRACPENKRAWKWWELRSGSSSNIRITTREPVRMLWGCRTRLCKTPVPRSYSFLAR